MADRDIMIHNKEKKLKTILNEGIIGSSKSCARFLDLGLLRWRLNELGNASDDFFRPSLQVIHRLDASDSGQDGGVAGSGPGGGSTGPCVCVYRRQGPGE